VYILLEINTLLCSSRQLHTSIGIGYW